MITAHKFKLFFNISLKVDIPSGKYNDLPDGINMKDFIKITEILSNLDLINSSLISSKLKAELLANIIEQVEDSNIIEKVVNEEGKEVYQIIGDTRNDK